MDAAGILVSMKDAFTRNAARIEASMQSLDSTVAGSSERMAEKLEAAGLMGLVTTVFKIYYRVRQFLAGLSEAFAQAFERIGAILGPTVRALMEAYGSLYKAIFSVFGIFGQAATSADASTYKKLGQTLGTVIGVIAQVGAFILKGIIEPLVSLIKVVTAVVQVVVWLVSTFSGAFISAAQFVYKFFLPLRLLVQAFQLVARAAYIMWQVLSGEISALDGLKSFGGAVLSYMATPFLWLRDIVLMVWESIKGLFGTLASYVQAAAGAILSAFMNLPLVRLLMDVIGAARNFLAGDTTFLEAGRRMMFTLGRGILSAATYPFTVLKSAVGSLRRLLPFSDAETGPLSTLTASGASLLKTFSQGMMRTAFLPGKILGDAFQGMLSGADAGLTDMVGAASRAISSPFTMASNSASAAWARVTGSASSAWARIKSLAANSGGWMKAPFEGMASSASSTLANVRTSMAAVMGTLKGKVPVPDLQRLAQVGLPLAAPALLAGTLALTPVLSGAVPALSLPNPILAGRAEPAGPLPIPDRKSLLLAETRGGFSPSSPAVTPGTPTENLASVLDAILAKLDAVSDRPIDVRVTTTLDGRQIAQSVYKDLRERKVKNYETS